MASYTVRAGDSWASIAGNAYGNQRWLIELAQANGMSVNDMLHPGMVIDLPNFDLSQTPVITNEQWAGVPTGVSGGQTQYGNSGGGPSVPSFQPPAIPTFGGNGTPPAGSAGKANQPYNPYTASGVQPGSAQAAQLNTPIRGRSYRPDQMAGIPPVARAYTSHPQNGSSLAGRSIDPNRMSRGRGYAEQFAATHGMTPQQFAGQAPGTPNPAMGSRITSSNQPRPGSPATTAHNYPSTFAGSKVTPPTSATNTATPGQPPQTAASDMSNVAWAARYTGVAISYYGRSGNRNQLPNRISARVAAQLPYLGAGFGSTEEFMSALGYRLDADGNWTRYDPQVTSGYRPQTYSAGYGGYGGGGGGSGGGGGFTRGPMAQGYDPLGLVSWRIGA